MIDGYKPKNDWRSIPQNIRFIVSNPCGASPWIYVETLVRALGDVFLDLVSIDPRSVAIGYLRPKSRRGWRRNHKGETTEDELGLDAEERGLLEEVDGELREGRLPDISRAIGKHIPGHNLVQSITDNRIGHLFWIPIDFIERGLWYWMLADLTKDGIYDWASDIYSAECVVGGDGFGYLSAQGKGTLSPFSPGSSNHVQAYQMTYAPASSVEFQGSGLPSQVFWTSTTEGDWYDVTPGELTVTITGRQFGGPKGVVELGVQTAIVQTGSLGRPVHGTIAFAFTGIACRGIEVDIEVSSFIAGAKNATTTNAAKCS